jgi:hypothetical protein
MIQSSLETIDQIRERIPKMTDRELREYGQAAAHMARPWPSGFIFAAKSKPRLRRSSTLLAGRFTSHTAS